MEGDWLLEIPHSPGLWEVKGRCFTMSEGPSTPSQALLPLQTLTGGEQGRGARRLGLWMEEPAVTGRAAWRLSWGRVAWDVNQRTRTHCLGVFILKAVSIILKLSNKIKEATKNIFLKTVSDH